MAHHHHEHSHYHIHSKERSTRIVVLISFFTMLLELYYGYTANSKTLIMDGWHMLSHVLVLMLAWAAYFYIRKRGREITHDKQSKVIALSGFASAVIMLLITLFMIYESVKVFFDLDVEVTNETLLVAIIGLLVNGASAYFLHREEEKTDVNLQAAYLHVVADVLLSFLAIVSLVFARYTDIKILDSVFALVGAAIILKWSIGLIRKSWNEILELRA
jgi:cation diffusion facilitator family transporter